MFFDTQCFQSVLFEILYIIICRIIDYVTVLDALQYLIDFLCVQQRENKWLSQVIYNKWFISNDDLYDCNRSWEGFDPIKNPYNMISMLHTNWSTERAHQNILILGAWRCVHFKLIHINLEFTWQKHSGALCYCISK